MVIHNELYQWWKAFLYGREYAFTQPEDLVKFYSHFEMYNFRLGIVTEKMRELYDYQKNHQN